MEGKYQSWTTTLCLAEKASHCQCDFSTVVRLRLQLLSSLCVRPLHVTYTPLQGYVRRGLGAVPGTLLQRCCIQNGGTLSAPLVARGGVSAAVAENSVCAYRRGAVSAPLPFLQQERGFRCPRGAGTLESCNDQLIGTAEALSAPLFPSCSKRGVSPAKCGRDAGVME